MIPLKFQINCVTFLLKSRQWLFISFNLKTKPLTMDCKALCPFLLCPLFYFSHADQFSFPQRVQECSCLKTFALVLSTCFAFSQHICSICSLRFSNSKLPSLCAFCGYPMERMYAPYIHIPAFMPFLLCSYYDFIYYTLATFLFIFLLLSSSLNSKLHYT